MEAFVGHRMSTLLGRSTHASSPPRSKKEKNAVIARESIGNIHEFRVIYVRECVSGGVRTIPYNQYRMQPASYHDGKLGCIVPVPVVMVICNISKTLRSIRSQYFAF